MMFSSMLAEQIDYLVFAAAIGLTFAGVQRWLISRRQLRLPRGLLLVCLVLLAAGWLPVQRAGEAEARRVEAMMLGFAPTYAGELARMGHQHLRAPAPADDPLLLAMIDAQKRWMRVNPAIVSIYTLRLREDGAIVFIVGAEVDYDGNGIYDGPREQRSVVGEVYEEAGEFWLRGFRGETAFDDSPYRDQWGTWVSAVAPMIDSQGRIEAVLGVDYDANAFLHAVAGARAIVIALLAVLLLSILSIGVIRVLHGQHVHQLAAEAALRREKDVAQAANKSKSDFLSNMSHELRTPLHAIIAFSRLGREKTAATAPEDKLQRYFARIHQSSERLLRLLDDLLDLSKLEAGRMTYCWERLELDQLAQCTLDEYEAFARERGVRLQLETQATPRVTGDAHSLMQVIGNLLSNAIKYTAADSTVTVTIARSAEAGSAAALVTVRDRGIGIPTDELEDVFDKFVQSSKTRNGAGGTGLGLSIARAIVLDHGGRIWATNAPDGGACFHVELPVAEPAPSPRAASPAPV